MMQIYSEVNWHKIKSMKDFVLIIEQAKDQFYIITTQNNEKLILRMEEKKNNKENILNKYGIVSDRFKDLMVSE